MKGKFLGLVLVCMGLALAAGCAGVTQSGGGMSEIIINAPPEAVLDYVCSVPTTDWNTMVKKVSNEKGERCKVGHIEDQTYETLGLTNTVTAVITEVTPERAVVKMTGDFNGTATYIMAPEGDSTRLIVIIEISGKLPPGMSYDAVQNELQKGFDRMLERIKERVEK